MIFIAQPPTPHLAPFVDCYWHVFGTTPYNQEKVLPTQTVELMFNLGAPHKVYDTPDLASYQLFQDAWIAGLQTESFVMEATAESNLYGIRFKPGGAYPFLNMPLLEFRNQIVEMDVVWGRLIAEIREQLFEAPDMTTRFQKLEAVLLRHLNSELHGLDAIQSAARQLMQPASPLSIQELSAAMGFSQKHLISQFKKMVGLSPKQLARISRFNQVLNTIDPTQPVNWTEIALRCHYYDQAHFAKDFVAFSGFTPSQYVERRRQFWQSSLQQGDYVSFVPIN